MNARMATAEWRGNLQEGQGLITFGQGRFEENYTASARFQDVEGTNPEELIAAAHAACFSMALANGLSEAGHTPQHVRTQSLVQLAQSGEGFAITTIDLETQAQVPGMSAGEFEQLAERAAADCPVSKALSGAEIHLQARLL